MKLQDWEKINNVLGKLGMMKYAQVFEDDGVERLGELHESTKADFMTRFNMNEDDAQIMVDFIDNYKNNNNNTKKAANAALKSWETRVSVRKTEERVKRQLEKERAERPPPLTWREREKKEAARAKEWPLERVRKWLEKEAAGAAGAGKYGGRALGTLVFRY